MKKIFSFVILVLVLSSCSEDIKFNNEAVFQGVLDNNFWKGANAKATLDANNKLTIEAITLTEKMDLVITVPPMGIDPKNANSFVTYTLGTSNTKTAYYSITLNGETAEYHTATGVGDGQVVVSQYDGATISGTFRFNAKSTNPDSNEIVNMQSGTFYKVPVVQAL